jgi:23S rRNA pseudouridine955/2504/2580 synthase
MITKEFTAAKTQKLGDFIKANIFGAGFVFINNLLKNKDVKINGARVGADTTVFAGDKVQIYYKEDAIKKYTPYRIIYEDGNVAVVFKDRGIETTSLENENTLEKLLGDKYRAAHRLDVNTEGLVVFSKTDKANDELLNAFANGLVKKTYLALVFGKLQKSPVTLAGYLTKYKDRGEVSISKEKTANALPVKTSVEFVRNKGEFSLLKINPITGRTHQIRAHLATIGLYIVGDGKYGDNRMNKLYNENKQCLCASQIEFAFPAHSYLAYLNKINLEAKPTFL